MLFEGFGRSRDDLKVDVIERFHSDAADEITAACKNLGIPTDESVPYEHQGNGLIEVFVRELKRHIRSVVLQSGMGYPRWAYVALW